MKASPVPGVSPVAAATVLGALVVGCTVFVYVTGGTRTAVPQLLYIPIAVAGLIFAVRGGVVVGLIAGLLVGPLMPLNVMTGVAQSPANWLLRLAMFTTVGALIGTGQLASRRRLADTERMLNAERSLATSERARLALTSQVLEERARERNRLALYVHDEVVPQLISARLQLEVAGRQLVGTGHSAFEPVSKARAAVSVGIDQARGVLGELREPALEGGLAAAIRDAVEPALRQGMAVDIHIDPADRVDDVALALRLLVVEAARHCIANVVRHADACRIELELRRDRNWLMLEVRDDDRGFDVDATPRGDGLSLLHERVTLAHGLLSVTSAPGGGTTVRLGVPLLAGRASVTIPDVPARGVAERP